MHDVVIVGAGIGGLTTGALLAKAGLSALVLESHVDPGGCAATFRHRNCRFDAGATLVGGFEPGGPHDRVGRMLGIDWPVQRVEPAMMVWLPDGPVTRWSDPERWAAECRHRFGSGPSESFWQDQAATARRAWSLAGVPWPPQTPREVWELARSVRPAGAGLLPRANVTVARVLERHGARSPDLRAFVDAQLLITAQATAAATHWTYGATALDFARPGVFAPAGGTGTIAELLAQAIERHGGTIRYKRRVTAIRPATGGYQIETARGETYLARRVVANVPPANLEALLADSLRGHLSGRWEERAPGWGAAMVYLELDAAGLPPGVPEHHQIVRNLDRPLGEGNSVFLTLSPDWDATRAPAGRRVATLSTHTRVAAWWTAGGREAYADRRGAYTEALLDAAEIAVPGLRAAVRRVLPATPVTFRFYTRRAAGRVGGFPQSSLFGALGPGTGLPNLYLVGDSIFPGQSTAAVTIGAERLVRRLLGECDPAARHRCSA